jgi:hypothetical protein
MYLNFNSQVHYDFTLVKNALLTFNNSLEIFPIFVLQKINNQFNINSIFYKISECNSEFVNICELIQQNFSKILLNNINNKNENYLNTSPNQTINTNVNFNNSNYNTNNNTINNFTNTYQFQQQQQQPNDLIYVNSNSNQNIQNLNNNIIIIFLLIIQQLNQIIIIFKQQQIIILQVTFFKQLLKN